MKADTLNRLRRNDRAMIRWICNVQPKGEARTHFSQSLGELSIYDMVRMCGPNRPLFQLCHVYDKPLFFKKIVFFS